MSNKGTALSSLLLLNRELLIHFPSEDLLDDKPIGFSLLDC